MTLTAKTVTRHLPAYQELYRLYLRAFPKAERVPWSWLMIKARSPRARFTAYFDSEELVGFTYLITGAKVNYLMYLAVNDQVRSKGYGSQILACLTAAYPKRELVLEIEHPDKNAENAPQRMARLRFYLRNHFHQTSHLFEDGPTTYQLLATDPQIDPAVIYKHHFRWFAWPLGWLYPAPKPIE